MSKNLAHGIAWQCNDVPCPRHASTLRARFKLRNWDSSSFDHMLFIAAACRIPEVCITAAFLVTSRSPCLERMMEPLSVERLVRRSVSPSWQMSHAAPFKSARAFFRSTVLQASVRTILSGVLQSRPSVLLVNCPCVLQNYPVQVSCSPAQVCQLAKLTCLEELHQCSQGALPDVRGPQAQDKMPLVLTRRPCTTGEVKKHCMELRGPGQGTCKELASASTGWHSSQTCASRLAWKNLKWAFCKPQAVHMQSALPQLGAKRRV